MDSVCKINLLPEELLIEIFKKLTQNELGQIARVCKRWNEISKSPVLWKEVDVKFSWHGRSQSEVVSVFSEKLTASVTILKLDFNYWDEWEGEMNFEELCVTLKEKCPYLHTLILHRSLFSVNLPSVIDLCGKFLSNLKVLLIPVSLFGNVRLEGISECFPAIEDLDISKCANIEKSNLYIFSKMRSLKKLNLSRTNATDNWFRNEDITFLPQLESLHLGYTGVCSRTFCLLQDLGVNLNELFLCWTGFNDSDFSFSNSVFPHLKTICLRHTFVTCEGIVSLVKSCESLQNIYIDKDVAESYANHAYVTVHASKLSIVKVIGNCEHSDKLHCSD